MKMGGENKQSLGELIKRKWVSLLINHSVSEEDKKAEQLLREAGLYVSIIPCSTGGLKKPEARYKGKSYKGLEAIARLVNQ